jgi:hypothetical protein
MVDIRRQRRRAPSAKARAIRWLTAREQGAVGRNASQPRKGKSVTKKTKASSASSRAGLDYTPQGSAVERLSYGVAPRIKAGRRQTAHMIVARRLENFEITEAPSLTSPDCRRHDVLLPSDAPDHCWTPQGLCDHFEAQALPHQTDLFGVLTLRCAHKDSRQLFWESVRAFLKTHIADDRRLPVVMALHIPSIAARDFPPHIHALVSLRQLPGPDFSIFDAELKGPGAKQILLQLWDAWCAADSMPRPTATTTRQGHSK